MFGGARRRRRDHVIGAESRADQAAIRPVLAAAAALVLVAGGAKRAVSGDGAAHRVGVVLAAVEGGAHPALHLAVGGGGIGRAGLV